MFFSSGLGFSTIICYEKKATIFLKNRSLKKVVENIVFKIIQVNFKQY